MGVQLSGRVLDSRPRGREFQPHRCHWKIRPCLTERLLMGHKESKQTKQTNLYCTSLRCLTEDKMYHSIINSKTCVKLATLKIPKIGFQEQFLSLNAGQNHCRMLLRDHSTIHLTSIKLPFVIKIFVLSIFEWLFYTGFTVFFFSDDEFDYEPYRATGSLRTWYICVTDHHKW